MIQFLLVVQLLKTNFLLHSCQYRIKARRLHTEKRMLCYSFQQFNSTDIRAEQDNVATPVTAVMATVCISTDIRPTTELM